MRVGFELAAIVSGIEDCNLNNYFRTYYGRNEYLARDRIIFTSLGQLRAHGRDWPERVFDNLITNALKFSSLGSLISIELKDRHCRGSVGSQYRQAHSC